VTEAIAFQSQLPRSFLGHEPVLVAQNLTAFDLRAAGWRRGGRRRCCARCTRPGRRPGARHAETFDAITVLLRMPAIPPSAGVVYGNSNIGNSLRQAAQIIKAGLGTRTIFVSVAGRSTPTRARWRRTPSSTGASATRSPPSTATSDPRWTTSCC
jgi:hypothetical protein